MTVKIEWIPPSDSDVGSVLIYRATTNVLDEAGTRVLLTTTAAKDANGNWILSYTDTGGTEDYVYRIQFWDGTGSSEISDPINIDYSELLATFEEVRRAGKISSNADIGSDEIYDAIMDSSNIIYAEYGDPIKRTVIHIDSTGSPRYDITGDSRPIYQVRRATIGKTSEALLDLGSYTINKRDGVVQFTGIQTNNKGDYVWFEWVPQIYNTLCKNLAALQLTEAGKIADGNLVETPDARRLNRIIDICKESLRPKVITTSNIVMRDLVGQGDRFGHIADYVGQKIDHSALPSN